MSASRIRAQHRRHGSHCRRTGPRGLHRALRPDRAGGPHMSATNLIGLIVSPLIAGYLLYGLLRGQRFVAMEGWLQVIVFCLVFIAIVPFLGGYMARVFTGERVFLSPVIGPFERLVYRVLRVDTS